MLFERVESEGLAHYSYIVGDRGEAVVIDPRRDCEVYSKMASAEGMRITAVLETHRNEDYVVGSVELSTRTGAEILHADGQLGYRYGEAIEDGTVVKVGRFEIEAISTPGHTPGSMSYLLGDAGGDPWVVFTGDALFAGDVGRVDLLGMERAEEMARLLYDSVFKRLLPLGDEVIACPAHGAGSVCAASIADRKWTTLGMERKLNPKLQVAGEEEFVERMAVELERPPYFREMERLNLTGAPLLSTVPDPAPLSPREFAAMTEENAVLDTRMELGFGAAHVPGALSIWLDGVPSFAGWFLPYHKKVLLVAETADPDTAVRRLRRIGYDDLAGYLAGGMVAWHMAGKESRSIATADVHDLCTRLDREGRGKAWILDVRSDDELESSGRITGAHHIHITQLPQRIEEVPKDRPVYIFCGSGLRSMVAASILQREGWDNVTVILGGIAGWSSVACPLVR
ncbi:MBL fold metallo-hydrolase [Methanocrinis sp.]|uniref:MBL fold metallo-hydrolase n=1 Tax=Methanocrinis sp. TaxID=3101522 RepID=UPI003D119D4D